MNERQPHHTSAPSPEVVTAIRHIGMAQRDLYLELKDRFPDIDEDGELPVEFEAALDELAKKATGYSEYIAKIALSSDM